MTHEGRMAEGPQEYFVMWSLELSYLKHTQPFKQLYIHQNHIRRIQIRNRIFCVGKVNSIRHCAVLICVFVCICKHTHTYAINTATIMMKMKMVKLEMRIKVMKMVIMKPTMKAAVRMRMQAMPRPSPFPSDLVAGDLEVGVPGEAEGEGEVGAHHLAQPRQLAQPPCG